MEGRVSDHCNDCGLCCMHLNSPPFAIEDWRTLRPELQAQIEAYLDSPRYAQLNGADAPCLWLDRVTGKCIHYEDRPRVCREYPVGGAGCRAQRTEVDLTVDGLPVVLDDPEVA